MNSFYTIVIVGLVSLSVRPLWGMEKDEKMDALNSQTSSVGFSMDTKKSIALCMVGAGTSLILSNALSHIDISGIIDQSASPLLTRFSLVASGVSVPLFFLMSLKNNPDFWNRAGFWNRGFLFYSTLFSMSVVYTGLSSLRS